MKTSRFIEARADVVARHLADTLPSIGLSERSPSASTGTNADLSASRRGFLKGAAASSLVLLVGFRQDGVLAAEQAEGEAAPAPGPIAGNLTPFVKIASDGSVTAVIKHFEMGQGTTTGLATLIAEEFGVGLDQIGFEYAPANTPVYQNTLFGIQGTGGSTAMANSFMQYRQAGAAARQMILEAAAASWSVDAGDLNIEGGRVLGAGNDASVGDFVEAAAALDAPVEPTLKNPADFTLIGNPDTHRIDSPDKINGQGMFAMDVQLDGQVVALIKRPPNFGATLISFDVAAAKAVPGYVNAVAMPNKAGVVVYGENTWAAMKARDAVTAEWDLANAETRSTAEMHTEMQAALDASAEFQATPELGSDEVASLLEGATQVVEGEFQLPYLSHAMMEPLNCTAEPVEGGVVVHDGSQMPTVVQGVFAQVLELPPENVQVNTLYAGGSFGRRASPAADYHVEAAMAFALDGGERPVKLMWTREDDIQGGYYRPAAMHRVRVGLDDAGKIIAWDHRLVQQSIFKGTSFESFVVHDGVDHSSVEGIAGDSAYLIPGKSVGLTDFQSPTPTLWWRSVGHSGNAFVVESMMDMAAKAAGRDPLEFRLEYLGGDEPVQQRMAATLELVAEKAGWGGEVAEGKGRGLAMHHSFGSYVAEVADVSRADDGSITIDRITCAVDCGVAVNPDVIAAQIEGAVGYGVGHAMRNAITFGEGGAVEQTNFPNYVPLRLGDIGAIDTHIVSSELAPSGIGEPGLPPSIPAVANAIAAAGGERVMHLPMVDNGVDFG